MGKTPARTAAAPEHGSSGSSVSFTYSITAIAVGLFLILLAVGLWILRIHFPYTALLIYGGVAALFAGIGATAAVHLDLPALGQAGAAGGAAAIAIILFLTVPRDAPDTPDSVTMTYYVTFSQLGAQYQRDEIQATVQVYDPKGRLIGNAREVSVINPPGGNALALVVDAVSVGNWIQISLSSGRDNKRWQSSAVHPNEGFIQIVDGKRD